MEIMTANLSVPAFRLPTPYVPNLASLSSFRMRKTNSYEVSDHFRRIKNGQTETLPELFLTFNSHEEATSFHCTYEINVGNLPDALKGTLHFVIEKGEFPDMAQNASSGSATSPPRPS